MTSPGGIRLGGAYYELTAESAPLIQALAQAEQRSKQSAQAIASATGLTERQVTRLAANWARAEKQRADASARETLRIIKSHNDAAEAADRAAKKMSASSQQASAGFLTAARGAAGFVAAAAGITTGAVAINRAMTSIAESTQRAAQAQFALNALYGQTAPIITKQAEELAQASGRGRTEALEAATAVANLGRQYAFTFEQQQKVLQISANLAAVRGIPLEEATQRVASALRGEAEAAEYLGQVLNSDAVKAFANMTEAQRENFESLSPITKAQIVLGKLIEDNADLMDTAAERANSNVGAHDRLKGSIDNLSASIGKVFSPSVGEAERRLADLADQATKVVDALAKLPEEQDEAEKSMAAFGLTVLRSTGAVGQMVAGLIELQQQLRQTPAAIQIGPDPGLPGVTSPGPTSPETAQAIEEQRREQIRRQAAAQDAIRTFVEQRRRAITEAARAEEQVLRRQAELRDQAIEQEIIRLEVEREARLKALEDRERATLRALEAQQRAEEQAHEATIERLEQERDARIAAAEAAADAAERAIEAEEERLDQTREQEDRAREDARRREDRDMEDARRVQDRVREAAHERELKRIERERDARIEAIEAEIEQRERATERALRNLDRQADKAREASDSAIRGIERQADREDRRHRKAMQALEDERDARLEILDTQLKALDAQEKAEDSARRMASLQRRVADAQRAAALARGSGTPEQIAEARGDLTRAIRVGNEVSIANARERLAQLAGQGAEAIEKADRELAEAQEDLRAAGVADQRDAERDKLKAAQDAIRREIEERRRALDDESRRRRQDLEDEKRAEQDKLKATLDRLDKKRRALQESSREEIRQLRATLDEERDASAEQIAIARDRFEAETVVLNDRRREEDRFREDQRRAQDRFREDERAAQDRALADQLEAVRAALELERQETEAHYTGPNGVITQANRAFAERKAAFALHLEDVRRHFQDEKQAINDVYRNTAKTGLIDLQDAAKENNHTRLGEQLTDLENWKNQANAFIDENKNAWRSLQGAVEAVTRAIGRLPSGGRAPVVRPVDPQTGRPFIGPLLEETGGGTAQEARPTVPAAPMGDPNRTYVPVVRGASPGSYVTSAGTHGGNPAADIFAPAGTPIYAPVGGRSSPATYSKGGNATILYGDDGRAYYFAHGNVPFRGGRVEQGQQIGEVGDTGNARGTPHLHFAIGSSADVFGPLDGSGDIPFDSTYWTTRDKGYLFREPTMTVGLRTGERNLIAERRPELLVSGAATAALMDRSPVIGPPPVSNYAGVGRFMAQIHPGGSSGRSSIVNEGDVIFNGVTYDEAERRQRQQQHRRSLLRGPWRLR